MSVIRYTTPAYRARTLELLDKNAPKIAQQLRKELERGDRKRDSDSPAKHKAGGQDGNAALDEVWGIRPDGDPGSGESLGEVREAGGDQGHMQKDA